MTSMSRARGSDDWKTSGENLLSARSHHHTSSPINVPPPNTECPDDDYSLDNAFNTVVTFTDDHVLAFQLTNPAALPSLDESVPQEWVVSTAETSGNNGIDDPSISLLHDDVFDDMFARSIDLTIGAYRVPVPCAYCKHHRLQCLIIPKTTANPNPRASCSSCVALFRPCSFAGEEKRNPSQFETLQPVIGHLHGLSEEDTLVDILTAFHTSAVAIPPEPVARLSSRHNLESHNNKRSSSRMTNRTKALRHWFASHQSSPFPSEDEKSRLAEESGMSKIQVQNWFTNARRRQRQQNNKEPRDPFIRGSPMPHSTLTGMTPFERWRHSPPEEDLVNLSTVQQTEGQIEPHLDFSALGLSDVMDTDFGNSDWLNSSLCSGSDGEVFDFAASSRSVSSFDTSYSTESNSSRAKRNSKGSHRRSDMAPKPSSDSRCSYQCTFCEASFPKKFDWCRHEKSIHLSLESWICQPQEQSVWQIGRDVPQCSFCGEAAPLQRHLDDHGFQSCAERPLAERTFSRKDHLWQHLQKFHGCRKWAGLNLSVWRNSTEYLSSRCGFCQRQFTMWEERQSHLARHFRQGLQMTGWTGDWGFDPSIMELVRQAVSPLQRSMPAS